MRFGHLRAARVTDRAVLDGEDIARVGDGGGEVEQAFFLGFGDGVHEEPGVDEAWTLVSPDPLG